MVGFASALAVELSSGTSLPAQLFTATSVGGEEATGFNGFGFMAMGFVFAMTTLSTLAPGFLTEEGDEQPFAKGFGPFTPGAEMLNARAALIGLPALFAVEVAKHSALF